jgi:hypothetical protein
MLTPSSPGQLDIRAIDENCSSWTTLKEVNVDTMQSFKVDTTFSNCLRSGDDLGSKILRYTFYLYRRFGGQRNRRSVSPRNNATCLSRRGRSGRARVRGRGRSLASGCCVYCRTRPGPRLDRWTLDHLFHTHRGTDHPGS